MSEKTMNLQNDVTIVADIMCRKPLPVPERQSGSFK